VVERRPPEYRKTPNSNLWLVEAKAAKTVRPSLASPLLSLHRALPKRSGWLIVL
jgi:hypothetical protein